MLFVRNISREIISSAGWEGIFLWFDSLFKYDFFYIIFNRCESLADLIWRTRLQVLKVEALRNQLPIDIPHGYTDMQPELNKHVTGLLSSLVTR